MPGTAAGTDVRSGAERPRRHLLDGGLHGAVLPRDDHVRLQQGALEHDVLRRQLAVDRPERPKRRLVAASRSCDLRPSGPPARRSGRGLPPGRARRSARARARLPRCSASVGRPSPIVMTARHFAKRAPSVTYSSTRSRSPSRPSVTFSPGESARSLAPVSTLMPGMAPAALENLRERRAVAGGLADRLVVEDHPGDVVAEPRRREEKLAVGAARLLGRLDPDRVESLLDRARRLVRREDATLGRDESPGGELELLGLHRRPPSLSPVEPGPLPLVTLNVARGGRDVQDAGDGSRPRYTDRCADVAQLVEHWLPKPRVAGSSPVVRSSRKPAPRAGFRDG